jgi:hypothetical protein
MLRNRRAACAAVALISFGALNAIAGECRLESPAHRVTLVELYTSEGCNSCPPADRWFSALPQQGVSAEQAVLLAFHVDYWNQLGWPDRFSRPAFSARQRDVAARASRGVVYTPQLVVDGKDLRQGYNVEYLRTRLATINRDTGRARIRASVERSGSEARITGEVEVLGASRAPGAWTWIATFENGLSSRVTAGENAGKQLSHDYVVRELAGPFSVGSDLRLPLEHRLKLQPEWNVERMGIAVFVERPDTGEVLEAAALYPLCAS